MRQPEPHWFLLAIRHDNARLNILFSFNLFSDFWSGNNILYEKQLIPPIKWDYSKLRVLCSNYVTVGSWIINLNNSLNFHKQITFTIIHSPMALRPFVGPRLIFIQSIGLPGWGISLSQGLTCTQDSTNRVNAHVHPRLKWDSNTRAQCLSERSRFMPFTAWPLWSAQITLRSTGLWRRYIKITVTIPSSCLLFKTQLNSIGLSVPHRKHITSPLRALQVNAIYRFVTKVY
jgi:hypothetical protein